MATSADDVDPTLSERGAEAFSRWPEWTLWLKHILGLDRAIAFTVLGRTIQVLGSAGTVLLIVRFLTPVEQGYYYTLVSLGALQVVFELGFSFVILQMAAHECIGLKLHADGRVEGDVIAHYRLASILQKTVRWYLLMAGALCVVLLPTGIYFFSAHARTSAPVAWHGPWIVAVCAVVVLFFLNPFCSFLEGCGYVWQVSRVRFAQAVLGAGMCWGALLAHRGLYAPGMANLGYALAALMFLYGRRTLCVGLLRHAVREAAVSWRKEIWPFQWKIAVSWACAYFSGQALVPLLFAYRGATEAGQFGMSLGITSYLAISLTAWMSTKATPFGQMIARGELGKTKQLFFRTLRQSLAVQVGATAACAMGLVFLHYRFPRLAARMVPPKIFVLLLLASVGIFVVQSIGIYLRSFKREPFLAQSVAVAASTVVLSLLTIKTWGTAGAALAFLLCTGILGSVSAIVIFRRWTDGGNRNQIVFS